MRVILVLCVLRLGLARVQKHLSQKTVHQQKQSSSSFSYTEFPTKFISSLGNSMIVWRACILVHGANYANLGYPLSIISADSIQLQQFIPTALNLQTLMKTMLN